MTPQEILNDDKFYSLPVEERLKVLKTVDSNFGSLPKPEQIKVVDSKLAKTWQPPTAEEEAIQEPGMVGTLLNPAEMVSSALTGGISALRVGKPIIKEVVDWATYGIPSAAKSVGKGAQSLVRGIGAKSLEKTIPVEKATPLVYEGGTSWLPGAAKATSVEMQGVIDLARREKVSILAPDVTGNRTQALLFNAADKAIGGAGITQKAASKVVRDMDDYSKRILSNLGGEYDPTILGSVARGGMETKFEPVEAFGTKLYDIAAREAEGVPTALSETTKVISEIKNSKDWLYLPGQVKAVLSKVFNDIAPPTGSRYGALPQELINKLEAQQLLQPKTMDFTEVESIRRAISKLSFHKEISGDIGNRFAGKLLMGIDKDMTAASEQAGTLAKEALNTARKYQAENIFGVFKGKTQLGKPSIGTRVSQVANEDFLKIISKGNITELQELHKILPMETMQEVKRAWLTDIFTKHQRLLQTEAGQGYMVNTPGVAADLNQYGDKYLKTLFSGKEFKMLDEFRKLANHVGYAEKIASNPSGTAQTIYTIQLITGGLFATYGTWKNDPIAAASGLIFTFGGPYAIAKFMTSEAGFKYMTTGVKINPSIKEIITNSLKSAAMQGTHANIDLNRGTNVPNPQE